MKNYYITKRLELRFYLFFACFFLSVNFSYSQAPALPVTPLQNGDKVLFIGNSFTEWNGPLVNMIQAVIKSSGSNLNVSLTEMVKGMGILKEYATWNSLGMMAAIKQGGWKYVVIQGWEDATKRKDSQSTESGVIINDYMGWPQCQDTMLTYLKVLDAEVRKIGAVTILYEPHVNSNDFINEKDKSNQTYAKLKYNFSCFYAPTILAWDSLRVKYPAAVTTCGNASPGSFIEKLYSDCGHQNSNGMALDAMTFYTIFTQRSASTLKPVFSTNMTQPELYDELAALAYTTGKKILAMNNCGFTDTQAPTVPTNLQTSNLLSDSYNLSWTESTDNLGVLGYNVYKNDVLVGTTSTPKIAVGGLTASTTYTMKVLAFDSEGNKSDFTPILNVTTPASAAVDTTGVLMSWDFVKTGGSATVPATKLMKGISATSPSSIIGIGTGLKASSFATNSFGISSQNKLTLAEAITAKQYITFTIQPQANNSMSIGSIQARPFSQNNKALNFTLMSSVKGFTVGNEIGNVIGNSYQGGALQSVNVSGHDNIASDIEFRLYLWGLDNPWEAFGLGNEGGVTTDDLVISGSVKSFTLPSFPTALTATVVNETGFTLNWKAAKNAVTYEVFRNGISAGTTSSISMPITGVTINSTYSLTVKATDGTGTVSEESTPLEVKIPDQHAPSIPLNLAVTNITSNSFILHWDACTDNVGVNLYEIDMNGNTYGNTADAYLPVPFLTAGTKYSMTVRSKDAAGNVSPFSIALNVTTAPTISGVDENSGNVNVYPNPTNGWVIIESLENSQLVTISDLQGKRILTQQLTGTKNKVNLDDLKSGIYILEVRCDKFIQISKLIIR